MEHLERWLLHMGQHWTANMLLDLERYVVFAIGAWLLIWVVLAGVLAGRKIRGDWPPVRQMIVEFLISMRTILIFSTISMIIVISNHMGWLYSPKLAASWGPIWFGACLLLMIVAHDAWFYWAHKIMHRPQLFRTFHRRHHRSHNPSPFTAYSFDLGEAAVMAIFVPLWVIAVPTPWPVLGLFMAHQLARNTMAHCGYELMPATADGKPMFDWITSVTHHDLHHERGKNYGLYFTWWDRWMGTEHPEYHARFAAAVRKPPVRVLVAAE
ncbi:sterol desaturase family protein [soil metagenome]